MNKVFKTALFLLLTVLIHCGMQLPMGASAETEITDSILAGIEKRYAGKSFEAQFSQISTLSALDTTEQASGRAWFSHPGKMKWEYLSPEQHEIITNGKFLWIYRPEENQVMQGGADAFFKAGAGGAFLSDIALIRKNYIITIKDQTQDYIELDLVPEKETPDISLIVIRVSRQNSDITRVVTRNEYGDSTLLEFSRIQFKPADPSRFEFTIPEGVNVVDLE